MFQIYALISNEIKRGKVVAYSKALIFMRRQRCGPGTEFQKFSSLHNYNWGKFKF